jgi:hypothetical protein
MSSYPPPSTAVEPANRLYHHKHIIPTLLHKSPDKQYSVVRPQAKILLDPLYPEGGNGSLELGGKPHKHKGVYQFFIIESSRYRSRWHNPIGGGSNRYPVGIQAHIVQHMLPSSINYTNNFSLSLITLAQTAMMGC